MSHDIKQVAKDYIDGGWQVVPVVKEKKRASTKWQSTTYTPDHFKSDNNIAGKCGEPSGWRVDVDLDALEAVAAAQELLPITDLVHGRPGKLNSHFWYICDGATTTQFTDVKDSSGATAMLVEIRSTGSYTVLPPSIWTDKDGNNPEHIAWSIERDPLSISPKDLATAVRNVAVAALLARHGPDQARATL